MNTSKDKATGSKTPVAPAKFVPPGGVCTIQQTRSCITKKLSTDPCFGDSGIVDASSTLIDDSAVGDQGGELEVSSAPEGDSTITFRLPDGRIIDVAGLLKEPTVDQKQTSGLSTAQLNTADADTKGNKGTDSTKTKRGFEFPTEDSKRNTASGGDIPKREQTAAEGPSVGASSRGISGEAETTNPPRPVRVPTNNNVTTITQQPISAMALRPNLKFLPPPTFKGESHEDAQEWLSKYEQTGRDNKWGDDQLVDSFVMYLDGAARKWFLCLPTPKPFVGWAQAVSQVSPALQSSSGGLVPQGMMGLKELFLQEFLQENYSLFQETRLRSRKQGSIEPATAYFYDVVDLCRIVNPNMSEQLKLEYLFRGLQPTMIERVYPLRPKTCGEFLSLIKIHTEASVMAGKEGGSLAINALTTMPPRQEESKIESDTELVKMVKELKAEVARLSKLQEGKPSRGGVGSSRNEGATPIAERSPDGRVICFYCRKAGHIARVCRKKSLTKKREKLDRSQLTRLRQRRRPLKWLLFRLLQNWKKITLKLSQF
jgi:hypothetical protein